MSKSYECAISKSQAQSAIPISKRVSTPRGSRPLKSDPDSSEDGPAIKIDATSLGNAVRRLREGLARSQQDPGDEQLRDGLIQRFEFTYELSDRMLRRYLKAAAASPDEIERMPFADLIRTANAQGPLLSDWPVWRGFREMRARTSHAYDARVAEQVASAIPFFLEEVEQLYSELRRRLA